MSAPAATREADTAVPFATTCWSMLVACGDPATTQRSREEALAYLCRVYWRPVFTFICRQGTDDVDAQDLTQEFFMKVTSGELLRSANEASGRFRSLLLATLQNFLRDANAKKTAKKRGGEMKFVSWDDWMAESPSQLSLPHDAITTWSGERLFDVRWAATIVEQAFRRLREECEARGRRRVFDGLAAYLTADHDDGYYAEAARQLRLPVSTVKPLVYRLRQRYRELLRAEVAQTVGDRAQIDDEIRYLCATLAATGAATV